MLSSMLFRVRRPKHLAGKRVGVIVNVGRPEHDSDMIQALDSLVEKLQTRGDVVVSPRLRDYAPLYLRGAVPLLLRASAPPRLRGYAPPRIRSSAPTRV